MWKSYDAKTWLIMGIRLSYTWTICIYYVRFLVLIVEENYKFTFTNVDADILRQYVVSKNYPDCSEGCKYAFNTTYM